MLSLVFQGFVEDGNKTNGFKRVENYECGCVLGTFAPFCACECQRGETFFADNRAGMCSHFSEWIFNLGIPTHIAVEIETENDNFHPDQNDREHSEARFNHMLAYLKEHADGWDFERGDTTNMTPDGYRK